VWWEHTELSRLLLKTTLCQLDAANQVQILTAELRTVQFCLACRGLVRRETVRHREMAPGAKWHDSLERQANLNHRRHGMRKSINIRFKNVFFGAGWYRGEYFAAFALSLFEEMPFGLVVFSLTIAKFQVSFGFDF